MSIKLFANERFYELLKNSTHLNGKLAKMERDKQIVFFVECVLSAFRHNIFGLLSNNLLRFIKYSHIFISFRVSEWMNGWECACACPRTMRMKQRRMDSDRNPFLHVQNIKVLKYIILCECERQCCRWRWWWWRRRRLLLLFLVQPHPPFLNFILFLLFFSFHNLVLFHFSIHICYGILLPQSQVFYWKVYFVRKNNDDDTYHGRMCQKFMHVVCVCMSILLSRPMEFTMNESWKLSEFENKRRWRHMCVCLCESCCYEHFPLFLSLSLSDLHCSYANRETDRQTDSDNVCMDDDKKQQLYNVRQ